MESSGEEMDISLHANTEVKHPCQWFWVLKIEAQLNSAVHMKDKHF
jgi:hypothetical protein